MQSSLLRRSAQIAASVAGLAALALGALPANAAPFDGRRNQFADSAFGTVWRRTDDLSVRGGRSWYWGPGAWFDYAEFYRQSPNGLRTVQYFDKARMEINDPANRSFQGGVTNGLLVVELVSGQLKKGNDPYDFDMRQAADVPVAGNPKNDNPNSPTYASFAGVATVNNGYRDANKLNQRVGTTIDKGGNLAFRQDLADAHPETEIVQYNSITGHNIPRVLWDFLNLRGPFVEGGAVRQGTIVDWTFRDGSADQRRLLDPRARRPGREGCAGAAVRAARADLYARQPGRLQGRDGQRRPALLPVALPAPGHAVGRA
jgi:hypothetical protein